MWKRLRIITDVDLSEWFRHQLSMILLFCSVIALVAGQGWLGIVLLVVTFVWTAGVLLYGVQTLKSEQKMMEERPEDHAKEAAIMIADRLPNSVKSWIGRAIEADEAAFMVELKKYVVKGVNHGEKIEFVRPNTSES